MAGLAYADISTGEFATTQTSSASVSELERLKPSEILLQKCRFDCDTDAISCNSLEDYDFELDANTRLLKDHFAVATLDGFGVEATNAIIAAGSLIAYLQEIKRGHSAR